MYAYQAHLERVIDGDTVRLTVDLGMYVRSSQSIRLLGVHAPELSQPGGDKAKRFVREWMEGHDGDEPWNLMVVTEKDKQTFNRYIGTITCRTCGEVLNAAINEWLAGLGKIVDEP